MYNWINVKDKLPSCFYLYKIMSLSIYPVTEYVFVLTINNNIKITRRIEYLDKCDWEDNTEIIIYWSPILKKQ